MAIGIEHCRGEDSPDLPHIPSNSNFVIGEYSIDHTLSELDGLAECWGWMPEPRHMHAFRQSPFYNESLRKFFQEVSPASLRFSNRIIRANSFIVWRIIDWACGMDEIARQWLDAHAGGSMTYALRTLCPEYLEFIYRAHMCGPGVRHVRVAPSFMTAYVDYAERLFGFHEVKELAELIPFLQSKVLSETDRPHDPAYFLSRIVAFILESGVDGVRLVTPTLDTFQALHESLRRRSSVHATRSEKSEYSDMTVIEEACMALWRIEQAIKTGNPESTLYLKDIWTADDLNETYHSCFGVPLRLNTPYRLAEAGCTEEAEHLVERVVESSINRWGSNHDRACNALDSQALLYMHLKKWEKCIEVRRDILKRCEDEHGNDHSVTLQNAARLAEVYARAGLSEESISMFTDTLNQATGNLEPDHFIITFCKKQLSELGA